MKGKKKKLEQLAEEANSIIIINKYLQKKLDLYGKYIFLTKDIMKKCLSGKANSELVFNSYINEIEKDYDILKNEYDNKILPNYQSLFDECLSDITMGKPMLEQYRSEDFALEYLKTKKDDIIDGLKKSIKKSKEFHLFREPKRDTLINDERMGNKEMEKATTELQQNMLYECKQCNKFSNKIKQYNEEINIIKNNIKILKEYINEEKLKIKNDINDNLENDNKDLSKENKKKVKKKLFLTKSVNPTIFGDKKYKEINEPISDENRGHDDKDGVKNNSGPIFNKKTFQKSKIKEEKGNKIIYEFKKVEDLFNISSEDIEKEKIIDDELHSDDETVFEKKIKQPIKLTSNYFDNVKTIIPDINLKQIEINKLKIIKEDDLYSLQRRKYKSQNIDTNIKEFRTKIKELAERVKAIHQKEKIMKEYIEKVKEKYDDLKPIRIQTSVYNKKTDFLKKSLFNVENIEEEISAEDMADGSIGSDYKNEENENSDKENENNFVNNKKDIKKSVFVGFFKNKNHKNNKNIKTLKQSVRDDFFKNKLREKLYKRDKANSK